MARWQDSPSAPPTIADTLAEGITRINVHCVAYPCGHVGQVEIARLPVNPETPFPKLERLRFVCTRCGQRRFQIMPDWTQHVAYGNGAKPLAES